MSISKIKIINMFLVSIFTFGISGCDAASNSKSISSNSNKKSVSTNNDPTKSQIFKFIKSKLKSGNINENTGELNKYSLDHENEYCTLVSKMTVNEKHNGYYYERKIILSTIDPSRVEVQYDVQLYTKNDVKSINEKSGGFRNGSVLNSSKEQSYVSQTWLRPKDKRSGEQIKSALISLIKQCGGTKELF